MQDASRNTDLYFIVEQLYPRDGLLPSLGEIGPSVMQVYRTVYELTVKQDIFLDGERISAGNTTLWQSFKYLAGGKITVTDSPGPQCLYKLAYSGSEVITVPLAGFESDRLSLLSKKSVFTPTLFNFGHDPVKNISLYGRGGLSFFMEDGGQEAPVAAARYNRRTGELRVITSRSELSKLMSTAAASCKQQ
ncbi:hypothetical protein [Siccibacter turicensis]|uniref:hypothetical protein n=1 Tax=Siccibacter turicensis TaxID=357233 RepID=UPI0010221F3B|nr:hypothetical protein [Siccibacter turicensis]